MQFNSLKLQQPFYRYMTQSFIQVFDLTLSAPFYTYYMTDSRHYDFVAFGAISPLAKYSFLKGSINYEDSLNVNNYFNISSLRKEKISENQFLKVIP